MARVNLHNTQVILDTAHKVDEKHMFEGGAQQCDDELTRKGNTVEYILVSERKKIEFYIGKMSQKM